MLRGHGHDSASGESGTVTALGYVRPLLDVDPPLESDIQRAAIHDLCRGEDLSPGEIYEEADGEQGGAFRRLLDTARRFEPGEVVVVAASLPVFADRVRDQAARVLQLEALNVAVRFADGRQAPAALRERWESRADDELRRDRAREGMRRKALRGEVLGRPPYGYRITGRTLEPEPAEAAVVRRIFGMYIEEDEGVRRIAKRLNEDGVHTRRGGAWTGGMVRNLLRNPVYTGLYRRLGVSVPRAHPAIIDRARFDTVQRRMEHRRTAPSTQKRHEYLLAGLLVCGACGNRMIGARRPSEAAGGGELVYYRCESATNQGRCSFRSRRAAQLEAAVLAELDRNVGYPVAVRPPPEPLDRGAPRLTSLRRDFSRMLERYVHGEWTWSELRRRSAANVLEQLEIEEAYATATVTSLDPDQARRRLLAEWEALPFAERRRLLRECVAEVVVADDGVMVTRRR